MKLLPQLQYHLPILLMHSCSQVAVFLRDPDCAAEECESVCGVFAVAGDDCVDGFNYYQIRLSTHLGIVSAYTHGWFCKCQLK